MIEQPFRLQRVQHGTAHHGDLSRSRSVSRWVELPDGKERRLMASARGGADWVSGQPGPQLIMSGHIAIYRAIITSGC